MTYLQSFSITRPIMPITMLASFAKLDTRADNPAKATVSVAVRCRMALTDSPVSALARRFGNAFDRLVIRCFPPPVESEGEWRLPQWPHCPRWPHLPVSVPPRTQHPNRAPAHFRTQPPANVRSLGRSDQ
jgi:hypothetical protein